MDKIELGWYSTTAEHQNCVVWSVRKSSEMKSVRALFWGRGKGTQSWIDGNEFVCGKMVEYTRYINNDPLIDQVDKKGDGFWVKRCEENRGSEAHMKVWK